MARGRQAQVQPAESGSDKPIGNKLASKIEPIGHRVQVTVVVKAADAKEAEQKVFDTLYPLPWVQRVRSEALDKSK